MRKFYILLLAIGLGVLIYLGFSFLIKHDFSRSVTDDVTTPYDRAFGKDFGAVMNAALEWAEEMPVDLARLNNHVMIWCDNPPEGQPMPELVSCAIYRKYEPTVNFLCTSNLETVRCYLDGDEFLEHLSAERICVIDS